MDLASFFFVLVVTSSLTVEYVLHCGDGLRFVSPGVGSENLVAWCARSISFSASLLLFLFGQMVLSLNGVTFVHGGAAPVAASLSWLGCCLGGVGLGLVFSFCCGQLGSFVFVFGFF